MKLFEPLENSGSKGTVIFCTGVGVSDIFVLFLMGGGLFSAKALSLFQAFFSGVISRLLRFDV